jgi:hypothetical protein
MAPNPYRETVNKGALVYVLDDERVRQYGLAAEALFWSHPVLPKKRATSPAALVEGLRSPDALPANVVLIDGDFSADGWPLDRLIGEARAAAPRADFMVMLPQADAKQLALAIASGARAVWLRADIAYGVATAILWARSRPFTFSAGLGQMMRASHPRQVADGLCLPAWCLWPRLEERWRETAYQLFLNGWDTAQAASAQGVTWETINTYATDIRNLVLTEEHLELHWDALGVEWAKHLPEELQSQKRPPKRQGRPKWCWCRAPEDQDCHCNIRQANHRVRRLLSLLPRSPATLSGVALAGGQGD